MRTERIVLVGISLSLMLAARAAVGDEWSLAKLNPFSKKEKVEKMEPRKMTIGSNRGYRYQSETPQPSAWQKFDAGTKKFFSDTKRALTWKKPAPKRPTSSTGLAWIKQPKEEKKSWFGSLFAPKEPAPAKSMQEFLGLPRPEF